MVNISAAELAHRASSDAEQVLWVDEHDQVLGQIRRDHLRQRQLIGRATFIFLFNSSGLLCVHQRTQSKALYPGYWDLAAGGMVGVDETTDLAAARELAEELGITDARLQSVAQLYFAGVNNRLWCHVYRAESDAPLRLQAEEVTQARFVDAGELAQLLATELICPDTLHIWQQLQVQLRA